jgi:hypothetical protein
VEPTNCHCNRSIIDEDVGMFKCQEIILNIVYTIPEKVFKYFYFVKYA